MARGQNVKPLFDSSKLKKGHRVEVTPTQGLSTFEDFIGTVVEVNPESVVLEGVPHNRQITVRPDGKRRSVVIDKATIRRKL